MKKHLPAQLFFKTLFIGICLVLLTGSLLLSYAQIPIKEIDLGVSFPHSLYSTSIDFKLTSSGLKKFKVVLDKAAVGNAKVKIYDIVGNLIAEDQFKPEDGKEKSFDFTHINSKLFVVEVGNSKYNKTKSIYAQPQGRLKKKEDKEAEK